MQTCNSYSYLDILTSWTWITWWSLAEVGSVCYIAQRGRAEKNCVTHSLILFRRVEYIVNPLCTGLPF